MSAQPDFWQRRPAKRLEPATERRTHILVADELRMACKPGWWWSHIPSGELRTQQTGALLKRMGLRPGMGDFLLVSPTGTHHWLELKRGYDTELGPAQIEFCRTMRGRGVPYAVARSFAAAVTQLKTWGAL
jgi:hypothetical protein